MTRDRPTGAWWTLVSGLLLVTTVVVALGLWRMLGGALDTPPTPPVPPPVADDAAARGQAVDAASQGAVKVLTYTSTTMSADFGAAEAVLTGEFLDYYRDFTKDVVAPAAEQKNVSTKAEVVRAGVVELHRDEAKVLLYINQTTTSTESPEGALSASAVVAGMQRIDGVWLINAFDPV